MLVTFATMPEVLPQLFQPGLLKVQHRWRQHQHQHQHWIFTNIILNKPTDDR